MITQKHDTGGEWPWQFFDLAGTILLALGPDGSVKYINRPGAEVIGYPGREILGREWFGHFLPERSRDEVRKVFAQISAGAANAPERFENPILRGDGTERIIAWRNAVARDRDGRFVAILSAGEDVTDQRLAAADLHGTGSCLQAMSAQPAVTRISRADQDGPPARRRGRRAESRTAPRPSMRSGGADAIPLTRDPTRGREQLCIGELHHRLNNLLAVVQAIARQTLADGPERTDFMRRLNALGRTHAILQLEEGGSVDLSEIVAQELAPYPADRSTFNGPPVALEPKKAEFLALILHELATNAAKYGGLSGAAGSLAVDWTVEPEPASLLLHWTERAGSPVRPPRRRGFGTRLIEATAKAARGRVQLCFRPEGLSVHLSIPVAHDGESPAPQAGL